MSASKLVVLFIVLAICCQCIPLPIDATTPDMTMAIALTRCMIYAIVICIVGCWLLVKKQGE